MKKENLIAQLEGAKALSSQVDIDKVIALLQQLEPEVKTQKVFGITEDLAATLGDKIQRALDYNSDSLVDKDSACFEINYDNRVELTEVNIDIYEIMSHVSAVLEEFVVEEDEPKAEEEIEGYLTDISDEEE